MKNKLILLGIASVMVMTVATAGFPVSTSAQVVVDQVALTPSQISAIISLLQSFGASQDVINNVQAALTGKTSTSPQPTWCHTFNYNLTVGSSGDDVSALQYILQSEGLLSTSGDDKGTFGEGTAAAVVQFQAKYGIRQTGYVGPLTRAQLNKLYGCGQVVSIYNLFSSVNPKARTVTYSLKFDGTRLDPASVTLKLDCPSGVNTNFIGEDVPRCAGYSFGLDRMSDNLYQKTLQYINNGNYIHCNT